jgi:Protein of unknown function (DUF2587)
LGTLCDTIVRHLSTKPDHLSRISHQHPTELSHAVAVSDANPTVIVPSEVVSAEVSTDGAAPDNVAEVELTETVSEPGKVMRIGSMIKQLLEEVRQAPLDEGSRVRLSEIYETSIKELSTALSPDLRSELQSLASPFGDAIPSDSELRIAQAQLVGWLEGLFHGIQATLMAQQMAAQAQLQQMRGQMQGQPMQGLPPGSLPGQLVQPGVDGAEARPGTYL